MKIQKTTDEWNKLIKEKDEQIRALYKRIKDSHAVSEAHQKLNGVLQSENTELKEQLKKIEEDRLNAGRWIPLNG